MRGPHGHSIICKLEADVEFDPGDGEERVPDFHVANMHAMTEDGTREISLTRSQTTSCRAALIAAFNEQHAASQQESELEEDAEQQAAEADADLAHELDTKSE